jgi:arylsulfatase
MPHDPIASPTVRLADHLEPCFQFPDQIANAEQRLADFKTRSGRRPNILVILMDDVGWGDFGCYGGGVAVGAPTPNIDRLARESLQLTSCYSEPSCSPSRATLMTGRLPIRHGLLRPPMYGEAGGLQGEITIAELLSAAGYVTQCVGKWHMGENAESQPQNVGFDDFYGFLSVSDMYTEWRDPSFFPEIVYSAERSAWIENQSFNKCFVHAERDGQVEEVEEVTIPVLSRLDDKWCAYSIDFIKKRTDTDEPWFLYHNTRGAHFDNYPHERFLGTSPAKHPYKDSLVELDDIVGRLVTALRDTEQLKNTLIFVSSDNGPHMENWPDAAYTPFRCAKGSTWEGGVRVPGIFAWPGMIQSGVSDGLFNFSDFFPTALALAGASGKIPSDRFIDGVDQMSFLLTENGLSSRKHHYYWLGQIFSAIRVGEYKMVIASTSDDDTDLAGPGGFTGVTQRYTYPRLYNLYLDPKETRSYFTRKLAYIETFNSAIGRHIRTLMKYPPKRVVGMGNLQQLGF